MDPIADFLIQIKNAGMAGREMVSAPYSKLKFAIAQALLKEGYIASAEKKIKKQRKVIQVGLVYEGKLPRIKGVKRVSKPSRRSYLGMRNLRKVKQGYGDLVLSTPEGILTASEAKKRRVGGEELFEIW